MGSWYLERAQFVIGEPNAGKSVRLRSMFRDRRLDPQGVVPTERKITERYALGHDRWLYVRLTSPHEAGEDLTGWLAKTEAKLSAVC